MGIYEERKAPPAAHTNAKIDWGVHWRSVRIALGTPLMRRPAVVIEEERADPVCFATVRDEDVLVAPHLGARI